MNTVELQELFDIEYGNQLNLNQMDKSAEYGDEVVNFVSRRGSNLGVLTRYKLYQMKNHIRKDSLQLHLAEQFYHRLFNPDHFILLRTSKCCRR